MRQYTTPLFIQDDKVESLERIDLTSKGYDEDWIQNLCFSNQNLLPIEEIETTFAGGIPICRELSVASGSVDLIYVNESGFITVGECKLWRNPEARRKVVGQILDYAKDISRWSYTKFEQECLRARGGNEKSLFEIIQEQHPDIDEIQFIDSVQKNLSLGRFMLAIIGDGIHQNTEQIMEYLDSYGHLNFSLGLIELSVYAKPDSDIRIVTPRILARTVEVEKHVYRIIDRSPEEDVSEIDAKETKQTISEQVFYEKLEKSIGKESSDDFKTFVKTLSNEVNITPKLGRGKILSLNLKSADGSFNFASIQDTGEVWFYGVVTKAEELGNKQVGLDYLRQLAEIVGGEFYDKYKEWSWCVKSNSDKYLQVTEYLKHTESWLELITATNAQITELSQG